MKTSQYATWWSRRWYLMAMLATALVLNAQQVPATMESQDTLNNQIIRSGDSVSLSVDYMIQRLISEDRAVCDGEFSERGNNLVLRGRSPGKAVITLHDVANTVRDRFECSVLSAETHALWGEIRGQFTNQEGLQIGVVGDQIVLSGAVYAEEVKRRAERVALRSDHVVSNVAVDPLAYLVLYGPKGRYIADYELLDEFEFSAWHGGNRHLHAAIRIEGITVAMLRTEAGWPSVQARAITVVESLNRAILRMVAGSNGRFGVMDVEGGPAVYFQVPGQDPDIIILVTGGDEIGYQRRSPGYNRARDENRRITRRLVAEWWRALLADVTGMFIGQVPPQHLRLTEDGTMLALFFERARGGDPEFAPVPHEIARVLAHASADERLALDGAGGRIPVDFRGS